MSPSPGFYHLQTHTVRLWGPPSLHFNGYRVSGDKLQRCDADHSAPSLVAVDSVRSHYVYFNSLPSWRVWGNSAFTDTFTINTASSTHKWAQTLTLPACICEAPGSNLDGDKTAYIPPGFFAEFLTLSSQVSRVHLRIFHDRFISQIFFHKSPRSQSDVT